VVQCGAVWCSVLQGERIQIAAEDVAVRTCI